MMTDQPTQARSQTALLALQGTGLVLLTVVLILLFLGGNRRPFLGAILAGLGAMWILQRPHWGVLILLVLFFLLVSPSLLGIRYFGIPYLVSALLLVPLALSILHDRRIWVWQVPQIKILLAIGMLFLISTLWNDIHHPVALIPALDETERMVEVFVTRLVFLVFFLYFITTRQTAELTVWLIVGLSVMVATNALLSFVASGGADRAAADFSLAKNSNRLAFVCLFATSFLWFYYSYGPTRRWKALVLPLLFFLPTAALTAGSRSGLLQMVALVALVVKEQKGWSAAKRTSSILLVGCVALLLLAVVPTAYLERATSFDPNVSAAGQESLQTRLYVIFGTLRMIAARPIFGVGLGNFPWMAPTFLGSSGHTHNSYLWALVSGGIGTLTLYLLLFFITYRMLRQLEQWGPRELLWISKGLKVNLILFLIYSGFTEFWLNLYLYVIVGLTVTLYSLWQRQERKLALTRSRSDLVPCME